MPDVLIVYASNHGHTGRIARRLASCLDADGVAADVVEAKDAGDASPAGHIATIVAASLHAGHHQKEVVEWVRTHATTLAEAPSVFLSVSLTAAEDSDEARKTTGHIIDEFLDDTGWMPTTAVAVAGAFQYQEYDPFTRLMMRLIAKRKGAPTDAHHDYEYTDWEALDRLAHGLAASLVDAGVA